MELQKDCDQGVTFFLSFSLSLFTGLHCSANKAAAMDSTFSSEIDRGAFDFTSQNLDAQGRQCSLECVTFER